MSTPIRVHVVAGGFPPGKHAGHDIDYARMRNPDGAAVQ